jgi:hypothetical protein
LLPRTLVPNPSNSGLGNAFTTRHQYSRCSGPDAACPLVESEDHTAWFAGLTTAHVRGPFSGGAWRAARRIKFMEISLPGRHAEALASPYTSDRSVACRGRRVDQLWHAGVREDWYFVDGFGLVLLLQRPVGLAPKLECVYEVAREQLTFANAGSWAVTVERGASGYDPSWGF